MFIIDESAAIVTSEGLTQRGTLVAWTPDEFDVARQFIEEQKLPLSYFSSTEPWSGLFTVPNAMPAGETQVIQAVIVGPRFFEATAIGQALYIDDGSGGPPPLVTEETSSGEQRMRRSADGGPLRWTASLGGLVPLPDDVMSPEPGSASPGSHSDRVPDLVAATTVRKQRLRALNLVEEIAKDLLDHTDHQARSAAHLALAATEALRPYVDAELDEEQRELWRTVLRGARLLLDAGKVTILVKEIVELAKSFDIPL